MTFEQENKPSVKKNVRFTLNEPQQIVLDEITPLEKPIYWYRPADYASFEREIRATLRALRRVKGDASRLEEDEMTLRGLERFMHEYSLENRTRHATAVLEEQEKQRMINKDDPIGLRQISMACSEWSRNQANIDAEEISREVAGQQVSRMFRCTRQASWSKRSKGYRKSPASSNCLTKIHPLELYILGVDLCDDSKNLSLTTEKLTKRISAINQKAALTA